MTGESSPGQPERRTRRRIAGDSAEEVVARHLAASGWAILARNVRIGRLELDIVALDSSGGVIVIVEVRSRTVRTFGEPEESVDTDKVARLYRAARELMRSKRLPDGEALPNVPIRVDLISVVRDDAPAPWRLGRHIKGLEPP